MKTDVTKIAKTTGKTEKEIESIKRYLFIDEHNLGEDGVKRFDPDYMIAESWRRLIEVKLQNHDFTLIEHELMERELVQKGYTQDEAHIITSKQYNYGKEAGEYYAKIKKHKKG